MPYYKVGAARWAMLDTALVGGVLCMLDFKMACSRATEPVNKEARHATRLQ